MAEGRLPRWAATILRERPALTLVRGRPDYAWLVVATVCVGAFMGQLDASIVTLAIPTLQEQLGLALADVEWVALAYLLSLAGCVVVFGRLADLVGRKSLYTLGFCVFTLGSLLCGLAPGLSTLIGARVAQAVGAAMLQANSVALITQTVPRRILGRAIGVQGAAQAIGLSVGPAAGGFLVQALDWRWIFFVNVPVGVVAGLLAVLILPTTPGERRSEPFDWGGALLLVPAIALLTYIVTHGRTLGWGTSQLTGLIFASAGLFMLFGLAESRISHPLIDSALFRRWAFTTGILAGLLSYAVLFGALFLVPVYLERIRGFGAAAAGSVLVAVPAALGLAAPLGGLLADRYGPRAITAGGMLIAAVGLVLTARSTTAAIPLLPALVVFGLGLGLFTPANNATIMAAAPAKRLGIAGGILNMTRSLGTTVGVAASGAILEWRLAAPGSPAGAMAAQPATAAAFEVTLFALAALALGAAGIALARGGSGEWAGDARLASREL